MAAKDTKGKVFRSDDHEGAATIAARHLINPAEDKLVEVSYIPTGVVHPLVMLQAFEGQFSNIIRQVRAVQQWYIRRQARREGWDLVKAAQELDNLIVLDAVNLNDLFIHRFRHAFCQTSRGKDGKFVESLTMLADTDLQTRSTDMESPFRHPITDQ